MQENWLMTKELKIYYRKIGKGPSVILIHGFAEDGQIWDNQIDELKNEFQLLIPDLPGSGKSTPNDSTSPRKSLPTNMEGYADIIKNILDKEALSSCTMMGHSMGGYITLAFAKKYPNLLKGFGLVHSTAYPDTEEKKLLRQKSIQFIEKNGVSPFLKQSTPNLFSDFSKANHPSLVEKIIAQYDNFNPQNLVSYYEAMMARPDRSDTLKQFPKPVLFIIGENDQAVPLKQSLELCYLPKMAYITILENTGHMGMLESPDKTNLTLKTFLNYVAYDS
jgi:pimeloyl-ACP methyl ester carboxylesterase